MRYEACEPVRVTDRGQMKKGDVLAIHRKTYTETAVFVCESSQDRFRVVKEVNQIGCCRHHLYTNCYSDYQIKCRNAYLAATNCVEIIGRMPPEQVDAMLADGCLDCRF